MGFSVLGVCVGGFVLFFLGGIKVGFSQSESFARNYISWDDLKVDDRKLGLNTKEERVNGSRIIVVDKNGGGDSLTVQGAVDMVPEQNTERVKIYILPGIYREKVLVPISKPYISFIGNQKKTSETVITWNNKASDNDGTGCELGTYRTASVAIEADYFCATGITFENTVVAVPGGYGMQAVALRVAGDKAMFYRVQVLGTQDTLLDETGSHYFYHCHIQGNVDFIFGRSRSIYQECVIQSTAENSGAIAAHHRDSPYEDTGFSFVNCKIIGTGYIYLGRAWGNYSRAVYSYCHFDDIITPPRWSDWNYPSMQNVIVYNKCILDKKMYNWPFPISFTMIHMSFYTSLAFLLVRIFRLVEPVAMSRDLYLSSIIPIIALYSFSLWLSNSTFQMLKALMPVIVYSIGVSFEKESFKTDTMVNMNSISIGIVVAAYDNA
ncbi:pectinesterase QRT1-like [Pyrus ussuriensis x Pyrus communis]|uniref:pectinesterase n=1 Tax=Pyrus ussuriensis x Pyrus communis TaxID=2448454 RepID=A0A5N5GIY1_9ROSA|nr:pectinesterase QRT1-like [Pyrus ussuriensis x Pyrus communis]